VVGTLGLLDENERKMVKGIIVNRFRGDASLFEDGVEFLKKKTGIDSVWVVPDFGSIEIDSEDSLALDKLIDPQNVVDIDKEKVNIAVIRFPHISNFTDFAPLVREPCANLFYMARVPHEKELEGVDLLILPGTKNVRADLEWLKSFGWAERIKKYYDSGGRVFGICGGYQILGNEISDPHGVEGKPGSAEGLGLLDIKTIMEESKKLSRIKGKWLSSGLKVSGYEIHMGRTELGADAEPVIELEGGGTGRYEGAHDKKGRVWGSYLHGLFDEGIFRNSFLGSIKEGVCAKHGQKSQEISAASYKQTQYDMLAEHFKKHIDVERLIEIAGLKGTYADG
ncbi:MAG: cobyric acid synthase, partial [Nitrospinota bacterium]